MLESELKGENTEEEARKAEIGRIKEELDLYMHSCSTLLTVRLILSKTRLNNDTVII